MAISVWLCASIAMGLTSVHKIHIILISKLRLIGSVQTFICTRLFSFQFFFVYSRVCVSFPLYLFFVDCFLVLTVRLPTER